LSLALFILVRIPAVQTYITGRLTNYLSSELHTKVEIRFVEFEFFKKMVIHGIYVEDLHQDTLLYAERLKADISVFSFDRQQLDLPLVELRHAVIKLKRYKEDDDLNIVKLLEQLDSGSKDTNKTGTPWNIRIGNVFLIENNFSYRDLRYDDYTPCVDFDDVVVTHLNAHLEDIEMKGDSLFFNAKQVSLKEKSGFVLKHLAAVTKIGPDEMRFEKLQINTPGTDLKGQLTFNYNSFGDFQEFIEKVNFKSKFDKTVLDSRDIAFFARELIGLDKKVVFTGEIRGTVDNIKGRNMDISYMRDTRFKGNISLRGLPDVEETFIDLMVDVLTTRKSEIESIPEYPFGSPGHISIPENLSTLGKVKFKGKFTGFYNDFVAYGNLGTAIGYLTSDINLKFDRDLKKSSYSGNIAANNFDVGKFWALEKYMGGITFNAKMKGTGFSINNVNAALEGNIADFNVNGYDYKNISVDGKVAKKLFSGALNVSENNVHLDFNGKVDFSGELPVFDFYANLDHAYLTRLNLSPRDTGSYLGCEASMNFKGFNIDNLSGNLLIRNIRYREKGIQYGAKEISLKSVIENEQKSIILRSDMVDAEVKGAFRLSSAIESFRQMLGRYVPAFPYTKNSVNEPQSFTYNIEFKKTNEVCSLFVPDLYIDEGTTIKGIFNTAIDEFNMQMVSDRIAYGVIDLNRVNLKGNTVNRGLNMESTIGEFYVHDSLKFNEITLLALSNKDSLTFSVVIANYDSVPNSLDLRFLAMFNRAGQADIRLLPSTIKLDYKYWLVDPANLLAFDSAGLHVNALNFSSAREEIKVNGIISSKEEDALEINLKNFQSAVLNKILKVYDINIGGLANGTIKLNAITGDIKMESDLVVENFSFFNDTLGDAYAIANWKSGSKVIDIDGHIDREKFKNIQVKGQYIIRQKDDSLAFDIEIKKFQVSTLNHYLKGVASDARGLLNADLKLSGTAQQPLLMGKGNFQKTSFVIDYLNTRYSFADEFTIDEKQISFNNITLNDEWGNIAMVSGSIYHRSLKDFFFNIVAKPKNFECLNTSYTHSDLFYGHAFVTGVVKISGDLDFISMDISLKSEKGTIINMPLSNPTEIRNKDFINFIDHNTAAAAAAKYKVDLSGIEMSFDLDITPDAEIKLIFDEKIGDVITGRGSGNINMTIDPLGSFNIYGNYEINSGNYLFTLQNLINKDFKIQKGGSIKWNGDPYDAQIDLEAVYKLNAVLNDLIQDTASNNYNKRYPVELHLGLTEKLFNPKIAFRIDVPDLDPTTESIVARYLKTEEEVNTQVFSLLLARRFSKPKELQNSPSNVSSSSNPVGENAAELLSSQVSQWISQISTDFDLGVNYRPGNQVIKDEFELMVSTSILNDRVNIESNVGVANDNSNSSNIVGDFNIEYKISPDGRFRVKAFNKTNNNSQINANNSQYTQGIGVFYRREFDTFSDLFRKYREKKQK
jgi:hypothetical protein